MWVSNETGSEDWQSAPLTGLHRSRVLPKGEPTNPFDPEKLRLFNDAAVNDAPCFVDGLKIYLLVFDIYEHKMIVLIIAHFSELAL